MGNCVHLNTEEEKVGRESETNKSKQTRKIENHIVQDSVGAGIAQWLERWTPDRKVVGSTPGRS